MFTIMENRKRARLEVVNAPTQSSNDCLQGVATSTNSIGSATLATIGGQSFILSNASSTSLPANILLSICDDNSDESEEYIIDSSVLQQIKQENSVATQTTPSSNSQPATAQLLTTVPQYRIVNQSGKPLNNATLTSTPSSTIMSSPVNSNSTLIPTSMQLSSGCEIYVIKEVVEPPKQLLAEPSTSHKTLLNNNNTTTIKLEPMSPSPAPAAGSIQIVRSPSVTSSNKSSSQQQQQSVASNICQNSIVSVNSTNICNPEDSTKRSLILEAYKKRDDKRRATHNEVERRRRDKINSWIFKLKEMLPTDINVNAGSSQMQTKDASILTTNATTTSTPTRLLLQQGSTTRTPPSDSKSQILIKACEYIKSMQEEIQSLRECLTENENLRLSNQRLQDELNNLRNKHRGQHITLNNNNNSINSNNNNNNNNNTILLSSHSDDECELTLNSLNTTYANVQLFSPSATTNNLTAVIGPATTTTTSNSGITYAKRELIIRDYVD